MAETDPAPDIRSAGAKLARGVCRYMLSLDFAPLTEVIPERGLRVDVMALGPKGELWVIECKSGRRDFQTDRKWQNYLTWCDRFFWAVDADFPTDLLPEDSGLMLCDDFGAEVLRMPVAHPLAASRRKALTARFARQAAMRAVRAHDPLAGSFEA